MGLARRRWPLTPLAMGMELRMEIGESMGAKVGWSWVWW
jgi:hypothetical protein